MLLYGQAQGLYKTIIRLEMNCYYFKPSDEKALHSNLHELELRQLKKRKRSMIKSVAIHLMSKIGNNKESSVTLSLDFVKIILCLSLPLSISLLLSHFDDVMLICLLILITIMNKTITNFVRIFTLIVSYKYITIIIILTSTTSIHL